MLGDLGGFQRWSKTKNSCKTDVQMQFLQLNFYMSFAVMEKKLRAAKSRLRAARSEQILLMCGYMRRYV